MKLTITPRSLVIIIGVFYFSYGCKTNSISSNSIECNEYYQFLKKNWVQKKDYPYVFHFKGEPLNWWKLSEYDKYCKENCMLGTSKKQIISLLGEPSKILKIKDDETFWYCLEDNCLTNTGKIKGKYLSVYFDSTRKVNSFLLMPPPIKTENDK